jgi:hypothetical protein
VHSKIAPRSKTSAEQYPGKLSSAAMNVLERARAMSLEDFRGRLRDARGARQRLDRHRTARRRDEAACSLPGPGADHDVNGPRPTGNAIFNYPSSSLGAPAVTVPLMACPACRSACRSWDSRTRMRGCGHRTVARRERCAGLGGLTTYGAQQMDDSVKPEAGAAAAIDPIAVELVRGAMRSIQGEMEALIERTAMSAFIREKKDFYAGLFDERGRFLAGKSRPGSSDLINPILEQYPADTIRPGDLYWYNDCYAARGAVSHSPDQVLVAPVFHEGELVAFAQAWAHFSDIGGMHAGSISPNCTEYYQEGIIVPVVRLAAEGRVNDELLRMFLRNSRFPDAVRGDMRALMASVWLGERRFKELFERFGTVKMRAVFDALIERVRRVLRERFRALVPNGTYRFTDTVDSDGHGSGPIKLRWRLEVTRSASFWMRRKPTIRCADR